MTDNQKPTSKTAEPSIPTPPFPDPRLGVDYARAWMDGWAAAWVLFRAVGDGESA